MTTEPSSKKREPITTYRSSNVHPSRSQETPRDDGAIFSNWLPSSEQLSSSWLHRRRTTTKATCMLQKRAPISKPTKDRSTQEGGEKPNPERRTTQGNSPNGPNTESKTAATCKHNPTALMNSESQQWAEQDGTLATKTLCRADLGKHEKASAGHAKAFSRDVGVEGQDRRSRAEISASTHASLTFPGCLTTAGHFRH